ncbi:unnamed protein product [Vitrella brassicaformis CCMP3155]|uniref:Uncharacterized protein n=1 Tax=Vitrella brassicaformis (strain CCMP3155) TaxID=1169540 RepID=A0A0G4GMK0_VITBC|nr:unnamed protein product [Vitrella brassicaformis CCMP3155]|eukprot:CEM31354.1 unnamed protein product [Vitrella brassicaformis CCMP3155]
MSASAETPSASSRADSSRRRERFRGVGRAKRGRSAEPSAAAASDEDQRRAERERELRQTITDTDGLVNCITAFLPLYLLGLLSNTAWEHTAPTHTHLTIDSTNSNERSVWQRVPLALVTQWANKLTRLTTITLRYPVGKALWCIDVFITVIEGHVAGRRAANMNGGTLRTITLQRTVRLAEREMSTVGRPQQLPPDQIAPFVPPPSLDALTTVTGVLADHRGLADRGWRMPSLETVEQQRWGADELGSFISSSQSLHHVGGRLWAVGEHWAAVFERMPEAAAGQRGPLAGLQSIGTIELAAGDASIDRARAAVDRLQAVLTSRGCRQSLTQLTVAIQRSHIDSRVLPLLQSLESLHSSCCRADANVAFEFRCVDGFDLSLFYSDHFPLNPSPLVMMAIQAAARNAGQLNYDISQHDLTHPVDSPSQAAVDIAKTLTFDNVEDVWVRNAFGFVPPPNTPSPRPAIIQHLQQLPRARELIIDSALGGAAGQLLAEKMPNKVESLWFFSAVSAEDGRGVLEGLGVGREVGKVDVGDWEVSLTEGPLDGWRSASFPSIQNIDIWVPVPDGLDPPAAAERIRDGISAIAGAVRGLQHLTARVFNGVDAVRDAIEQLLPTGTELSNNFTINARDLDDIIYLTATRRF